MIPYTPPAPAQSIPLIDLSGAAEDAAARQAAAAAIHRACRETGFFYLVNHGVPASLVAAQFAGAKRFFDLPLDAKMALSMKNSASFAGYEPIGGQTLDSQDDKTKKAPPDLKESFYSGLDLPDDHPLARRRLRKLRS